MEWFNVDKSGLAKVLARKGRSFLVWELVQNALDEKVTRVDVKLERVPGTRWAMLEVKDDSPDGFADLTHAFTLFAESKKKVDAAQRGRFNVGDKLVLAMCEEAQIASTTGTVIFNAAGRSRSKSKTAVGSIFTGKVKMTNDEMEECAQAVRRILVPGGVSVYYNGKLLPSRIALKTVSASLQTEVADADGVLRKSTRNSEVEIFEVLEGETASLFELGIPVVETGDRFHINVQMKVPLGFDRDSVPPAYLARIRALALEAMVEAIESADATSTWVKDAVERYGHEMSAATVDKVVGLRFGEKRVSFDPSDPEANHIAVSQGYQLVYGSQLSKREWEAAKRTGAILPAGKVTPSPRPFSEDGEQLSLIAREKWTPRMVAVEAYAVRLGQRLMGKVISVGITNDFGWGFAAAYGGGRLTLSLARLGHAWFDGGLANINSLLVHEFGHEYSGDHLDPKYHKALTSLAGKLSVLALEEPELFKL